MLHQRTVEANGIRIALVEEGSGPVVLLCHGFPETSYAWRHQMAALAGAGYRAVAPDLRGYGRTDTPADPSQYTVWHLVGDLVGILDALGEPQAVVAGNDWGATVAWHAALLRPDRFRAVVGMGVPMMGRAPMRPGAMFPQSESALFYTLYFQTPGVAERELEADVSATLRRIVYAASGEAQAQGVPNPFGMVDRARGLLAPLPDAMPAWLSQEDLEHYTRAFRASGFRGALNYYRNLDRNWELEGALAGLRITVPALYLAGERDPGLAMPGMREIIDAMPARVPGLRGKLILPGVGHWLPQEAPEEVSTAIIRFMNGLPQP